jgi:hypothetical protein
VTAASAAPAATTAAAADAPVTSVISIGGYVFYNMSYLDAVAARPPTGAGSGPPAAAGCAARRRAPAPSARS